MDVDLPFFGCPTAGNRKFHWEGETAAARAAETHGTLYFLSSLATTGISEIGELHNGPKVFQLYVWKDRGLVKDVIAKAKEGGFGADRRLHLVRQSGAGYSKRFLDSAEILSSTDDRSS